jgi:DNA-binding NarL/FixJ family response regulator
MRRGTQELMLSGYAEREAVEEGETLGAVDYIRKSCEFNTLVEAIKKADEQGPERVDGE